MPVRRSGRPRFQPISQVELCTDHDWRSAHLRLLHEHYRLTPYSPQVHDFLQPVHAGDHRYLADFNLDIARALPDFPGSSTRIIRASVLTHDGDRIPAAPDANGPVWLGRPTSRAT